jgi:hypothetical protein
MSSEQTEANIANRFLRLLPRSISPQQVLLKESPTFSVVVENVCSDTVTVLEETELWVANFGGSTGGFRAKLELPCTLLPRSKAVLRFRPTKLADVGINSDSHPLRIFLRLLCNGQPVDCVVISRENSIRVGGSHTIPPVENIGLGISPDNLIIMSRTGGYQSYPVMMNDLYPIDVEVTWDNGDPTWDVRSDDGVNLTVDRSLVLAQTRAWTQFGLSLTPPSDFPANVVHVVGTLLAKRCPVNPPTGIAPGACLEIGGRVKAVIAESAALELRDLHIPEQRKTVPAGGDLHIRGTLRNPFVYSLRFNGPCGASAFMGDVDVSRFVEYRDMTMGILKAGAERPVDWRFQIRKDAPAGRYVIRPWLTSQLYHSSHPWYQRPPITTLINSEPAESCLSVEIDVVKA